MLVFLIGCLAFAGAAKAGTATDEYNWKYDCSWSDCGVASADHLATFTCRPPAALAQLQVLKVSVSGVAKLLRHSAKTSDKTPSPASYHMSCSFRLSGTHMDWPQVVRQFSTVFDSRSWHEWYPNTQSPEGYGYWLGSDDTLWLNWKEQPPPLVYGQTIEHSIACALSARKGLFLDLPQAQAHTDSIWVGTSFIEGQSANFSDWLAEWLHRCKTTQGRVLNVDLCSALSLVSTIHNIHPSFRLWRTTTQKLENYGLASKSQKKSLSSDFLVVQVLSDLSKHFSLQDAARWFNDFEGGKSLFPWLENTHQACQERSTSLNEQDCAFLAILLDLALEHRKLKKTYFANLTFPQDLLDAIKSHPLLSRAAQKLGEQQKTIVLDFGTGGTGDAWVDNEFRGESIQGVFVLSTLQALAPDVFFGSQSPGSHIPLSLPIRDLFEYEKRLINEILTAATASERSRAEQRLKNMRSSLQMPRLKPANPFQATDRSIEELQAEYRISPNDHLCHIYAYSAIGAQVWQSLVKAGCNKIIVSSDHQLKNLPKAYNGLELTEYMKQAPWPANKLYVPSQQLYVLENDTQGKMLDLYRLSKLAVVIGPINFFEPLTVATPSLLLKGHFTHFSERGYFELVNVALNTGGALYLEDLTLLDQAVDSLLQVDPQDITPPYRSINPCTNQTAFEDYLDHLAQVLLHHLAQEGFDFWQPGESLTPFSENPNCPPIKPFEG